MALRLKSLSIQGFKSIRELNGFEPGPINVLIGANGAGKSNLVSFFRFMSWMTAPPGGLQEHVAGLGGANLILHDGAGVTPHLRADLTLETEHGTNEYSFRLFYAAGDTLIYADERYRFNRKDLATSARWTELGAGHREGKIVERAEKGEPTAKTILGLLRKCVVYQFHNTSVTARIRGKWNKDDNRWLKEDGANLAPFLLRLREEEPQYYRRIVEIVRAIIPFFADFELETEKGCAVMLQWRERGADAVFNASQASDGMLRVLALIALLGQPEKDLPSVLVLDEPELGLHPHAISIVAGMIQSISRHVQIIVATQSTTLVDYFSPEDIVVVNREGRASTFRRLEAEVLQEWLDEYSLAELWEKNVLGGRPSL